MMSRVFTNWPALGHRVRHGLPHVLSTPTWLTRNDEQRCFSPIIFSCIRVMLIKSRPIYIPLNNQLGQFVWISSFIHFQGKFINVFFDFRFDHIFYWFTQGMIARFEFVTFLSTLARTKHFTGRCFFGLDSFEISIYSLFDALLSVVNFS